MKTLPLFLFAAALLLITGCAKSHDPSPVTSSDAGSWAYNSTNFKGTYSTWVATIVESLASKPHLSALQADFSSSSPGDGDYSIATLGDVSASGQVAISVTDDALPAPVYTSISDNGGTVTVSHSGNTIKVTITNVKLMGFTADSKLDSIYVTGTIIK